MKNLRTTLSKPRRRRSTCASSWRWESRTTRRAWAKFRREVARVLTLIEERRADAALPLVPQRGAVQRARKAAAPAGKASAPKRRAATPASKQAAPARKASAPARKAKVSANG